MNPKIKKLREEKEKNQSRITRLQHRNKVIDEKVIELENTEIIGLVRESSMDLDALATFLQSQKGTPVNHETEGAYEVS